MSERFVLLPVLEQWDCHNCAQCCKGFTVQLTHQDVAQIMERKWHENPDFQGTPVIVDYGIFKKEKVLAQRPDGSCVFLGKDGLCRIHKDFGEAAKPWACRMFPFQITPVDQKVRVTMRRCCPSAARNLGRPLSVHLDYVRKLAPGALPDNIQVPPPRITRSIRRNWADTLIITDALEQTMLDERFPMVRRMTHGLEFCRLLSESKIRKLDSDKLRNLSEVLRQTAVTSAERYFNTETKPSFTGNLLFRQTAAEYVRMHPNMKGRPSWLKRIGYMMAGARFALGTGNVPQIHPEFPRARFDQLHEPLGHLAIQIMKPITHYFEATVASMQYCGAGRFGWSIIDGFRALSLAYAVSHWMLRWLRTQQDLTEEEAVQVVNTCDYSHYYPLLSGPRHKLRLRILSQLDQLPALVTWYAR